MMGSGDESDLNVVSEHDSDFTNSPRRDLAWKFGDVFKKREDFLNVDKTEYSPQKRRKLSTSLLSNVFLRCSLCEKLLSSFDCLLGVVIDGFFGRDSFEVAVIGLWSFRKTARRLVFFYQLVSRLFCKETVRRLGMVTNMYPSSALIGQDMDVTLDRDELMGLLEFPGSLQ
nr:PREDICTED: uncharacterized protein LOC108194300 [Daucus carota subsp. sativus]XP_017216739.1 PREDICTED: uncharacterized protein LOC108194300 [Daucus carota subsp. sativus]